MASTLEAGRPARPPSPTTTYLHGAEAGAVAQTPPATPVPGARRHLTDDEEADRDRTVETREVMKVLTQLPQGLPNSLMGLDMGELARAIVDGERRISSNGVQIVNISGKWYNADRRNLGVFLREWRGS